MGDDIDSDWVTEKIRDIALCGARNDTEQAARLAYEVTQRYGWFGAFLMCCGLAEYVAIARGFTHVRDGNPPWILDARDTDGDPLDVEWVAGDSPVGAGMVRAVRFLVAHLNDDDDMLAAQFDAAIEAGTDAVPGLMFGLLALAGEAGAALLREVRGPRPTL